jgi:hypothetical protein
MDSTRDREALDRRLGGTMVFEVKLARVVRCHGAKLGRMDDLPYQDKFITCYEPMMGRGSKFGIAGQFLERFRSVTSHMFRRSAHDASRTGRLSKQVSILGSRVSVGTWTSMQVNDYGGTVEEIKLTFSEHTRVP